MKTTQGTPDWAIELVTQVCKEHSRSKPGELKWKTHSSLQSGGMCSYGKSRTGRQLYHYKRYKNGRLKLTPFRGFISIKAGTSGEDQKLVLLHELAHWVCGRKRSESHTVRFWKKAFELYQQYKVDMEYAFNREKQYKQKAVQVYERYYKD